MRKGRTEWHSGAGPRQASGLPASFLRRARGSASSQLLPQTRAGSPSHSGAISELTLVHPKSLAGISVRPDPPSSPCGDPRGQRAVPPPECSPFGVRLPSVSETFPDSPCRSGVGPSFSGASYLLVSVVSSCVDALGWLGFTWRGERRLCEQCRPVRGWGCCPHDPLRLGRRRDRRLVWPSFLDLSSLGLLW